MSVVVCRDRKSGKSVCDECAKKHAKTAELGQLESQPVVVLIAKGVKGGGPRFLRAETRFLEQEVGSGTWVKKRRKGVVDKRLDGVLKEHLHAWKSVPSIPRTNATHPWGGGVAVLPT